MQVIAIVFAALLSVSALSAWATDDVPDAGAVAPAPAVENSGYLDRARELVMQSLAMIGVNYKFGGNTPDVGLDCSGLVSYVFHEVAGMVLPRNSQAMSKVGNKIDKTGLQPGDLVFFNTRKRPFSHVGIYIGGQRFVHAPSRGREVEVADMHDRYWQKRFNGARRVSF
jgi:cell wall-associated NlpC family hydrolase